jgi:hypothetical protein
MYTCQSTSKVVQCFSWHSSSSILGGFGQLKVVFSINKVQYSIIDLTKIGLDNTRDGAIIVLVLVQPWSVIVPLMKALYNPNSQSVCRMVIDEKWEVKMNVL